MLRPNRTLRRLDDLVVLEQEDTLNTLDTAQGDIVEHRVLQLAKEDIFFHLVLALFLLSRELYRFCGNSPVHAIAYPGLYSVFVRADRH